MLRALTNVVLAVAIVFAPAWCCCTARMFAASPQPGEPVKKSCCHCATDPVPAAPATPAKPDPCKCKSVKSVLAASPDSTAVVLQTASWLPWLELTPASLFLSTASIAVTFCECLSTGPGLVTAIQIAITSRLTC